MRERELRRRCRKLLNELDIRPPLDVHELCRRVGAQRGKPIRPVAHPMPVPGPFGAWITTDTADYVFYQQATSRAHQAHIVLHELGHILAGHRGAEDDALLGDSVTGQFPDLAPEAVRRALGRTSYDSEQEREAETVATIILEWASVLDSVGPSAASSDAAARRMGTALTDRLGWL
ncbi:hypothetical protein [Actinophytocola sediminis]